MNHTAVPTISFIVPAYNEERYLGPTLRAIVESARGTGHSWECVVADDASTDATARIAGEHGARVVHGHRRQIAATRNAGARASSGRWLIFVDADTIVNDGVVRAAVSALEGGAAGGGAGVRFDRPIPWYVRIILPLLVRGYRMAGLAAGCFLFCTREAFERAGGFDESLYVAEEVAMSRALRRQGRFVILRESVRSSARKIRCYTAREVLAVLVRIAVAGPAGIRDRRLLGFWYSARREETGPPE